MKTPSEKLKRVWQQEFGPKKSNERLDMEKLEEICRKEGVRLSTYLQYVDRINDEEYTQECLDLNFQLGSAEINRVSGRRTHDSN